MREVGERKKNQPCSPLVKSTKCAFSSSGEQLSHPPARELRNVCVEACCNYFPPNQSL